MALADILSAITTILLAAPVSVPFAYPYQVLNIPASGAPSSLKDTHGLHFWTVTRTATPEARLTNLEVQRLHTLTIRGHYEVGVDSVTEPYFQALVETVMVALRPVHTLAAPADVEILSPASLVVCEPRLLSDTYLVYYAELTLTAQQLMRG